MLHNRLEIIKQLVKQFRSEKTFWKSFGILIVIFSEQLFATVALIGVLAFPILWRIT